MLDVNHGKKSLIDSTKSGKNRSDEALRSTTPPSNTTETSDSSSVLPPIKILKNYGYKTPEEIPFKLPGNIQLSPTYYTPTPELDA